MGCGGIMTRCVVTGVGGGVGGGVGNGVGGTVGVGLGKAVVGACGQPRPTVVQQKSFCAWDHDVSEVSKPISQS